MTNSILATKIHIPPLRSNLVARPHLIQRLNDGITQNHRLILISAPAGYGKSTLLSEWVSQINLPVAWLSLEKGENNPVHFWGYFAEALSTLPQLHQAGITEPFLEVLQSPQPSSMDVLLTDLVNDLSKLDVGGILVLDDLHSIIEGQIHKDLVFLINHLPESIHGLHLVVASRMDPPWPLARWRVRDELIEVRSKDLRFSPEETITFFNKVMGLQLTNGEVALLDQRTEGWIAGLQLAALSMQSRDDVESFLEDFTGSHRFVLDYLLEEVLSQQEPEILTFLLRTSILEYLSAPLCDAITESHDSQAMLIRLEKSNMFLVPMDEERRWYRYHHLFSDMLQARLKNIHPEIIPALHGRAFIWYLENGHLSNALPHAIASNDLNRLVQLIEKYAFTIFNHNQASIFLNWLNTIPEAVMGSNPWLYIARAWLLAYLGQLEEIEQLLIEAEKHADQSNRRLMGYISAMWTLMGEFLSARVDGLLHAAKAFELLPPDEYRARAFVGYHMSNILAWRGEILPALKALEITTTWSLAAGDSEMAMTAQFEKANILHTMGKLGESLQAFTRTFQMVDSDYPDKRNRSLPIGFAYIQLSSLYLEWNNTVEAFRLVKEGIQICRRWGYLDYLYNGLLKLADVFLAIGDKESALITIREAKDVYYGNPTSSRVNGQEAMINLARGDLESASMWATRCDLSANDEIVFFHRFTYLYYASILQEQGNLYEASDVLERLEKLLEQAGAITLLLETLSQRIIILCKMSEDEKALSLLQRTLDLAKPEGFVRIFTSKGPLMLRILQIAFRRGIETEYIKELIPAFSSTGVFNESVKSPASKARPELISTGLIEPLSVRELQVLRLLKSAMTSKEISRELFVSDNTTRTHIRNIYGKLAVHGRIEAIQKAKELGLI